MNAVPAIVVGWVALVLAGPLSACTGCATLFDLAAPVCMAKVDCTAFAEAISRAEQDFRACAEGKPIALDEVAALRAMFGTDLNFQCCVGNALVRRYQP